MNTDRLVGFIGFVLGVLLYLLAGDSEAYLFPRVIAMVMAILGLTILSSNFIRRKKSKPVSEKSKIAWLRIIPVIALFIVYPWAIEVIGFYSAGIVVFLVIVWNYAPEAFAMDVAIRRIVITAIFFVAVFATFSLLLNVQTPRGILF